MRQPATLLLLLSVALTPLFSFSQEPDKTPLDPRTQPQFVNALPIPATINGLSGGTFHISVSQFKQNLGLVNPATDLPMETTVWGYNGSYPGPTILAQKDVPIDVYWDNNLVKDGQPLPHLLPIDASLHWALKDVANWRTAGVPIVTHIHGGGNEPSSDGLPDSWYTPNFTYTGSYFINGKDKPFHYRNQQDAASIWYHDHALGITRLNVYAGLAGFYLITDETEKALQDAHALPSGPYDMGLAIQDRMFYSNGELYYPTLEPDDMEEASELPENSATPEFFGDFILVNGKTWPVLEVEPRQYRFRILNGSDSRFYNLYLSSGQQFFQIGSDEGLLPSPVPFNQLLLGTGERRDVVIDFSDPALAGQTIILQNNARAPYPKGEPSNPLTSGKIMAFKVTRPLSTLPLTTLPTTLRSPIDPLTTNLAPRKLALFEGTDEYGRIQGRLGTVAQGSMEWMDPVTETIKQNDTEIWEIYNTTPDAHTIHLHLVSMQLLSRQKFVGRVEEDEQNDKLVLKESSIRLIGHPKVPGPEERGWKDTYIMYPGEVTRIITTFKIAGPGVWHCHILSHEDNEMMRPFFVEEQAVTKVTDAAPALGKQLQLHLLPNPFNSDLQIQLQLPQASAMSISIYDASGRRVRQVFSGQKEAGLQQFRVDGSRWSNGTYFCEIVVNNQRMVRKLTLAK